MVMALWAFLNSRKVLLRTARHISRSLIHYSPLRKPVCDVNSYRLIATSNGRLWVLGQRMGFSFTWFKHKSV